MKKSILFIGAIAVAGFVGLTAFGGQTKAQQEAEIASAIQNRVDGYRTELQAACETRITTEAQTQFDTWAATEAAKPLDNKAVAAGKKATKKSNSKGTKVDPLPNPNPPAPGPALPGAQKRETPSGQPNLPGAEKRETTPPAPGTGPKLPGAKKREGGGGQ